MIPDYEIQRDKLYGTLGDLPRRDRPVSAKLLLYEERDKYLLEKLSLDINGFEEVPAYLIKPKVARERLPVILYNHAHGGDYDLGKDELLLGNKGLQKPPYALMLSEAGYAALCIDMWAFGERSKNKESQLFKQMLWRGQVLWGMMVYDSLRAVDYLCQRNDIDPNRIGTLGISMGSTMAWWIAALDVRIKVCIDLCGMTDYQALIETGGLDEHGLYYYVPGLLKQFTTSQINTLIAPRPHLSLAGNNDPLTPPSGLDRIDLELRKVYQSLNASQAWQMKRYNCGHLETSDMRKEIVSFLKQWLVI